MGKSARFDLKNHPDSDSSPFDEVYEGETMIDFLMRNSRRFFW
jgi:hypothetical protein